jgi:phosphate/sulfate permease
MSTTAQTLGLSVGLGMCLFAITIFFGWLSISYNLNQNFLKWVLLPTLGYIIAIGFNSLIQGVSCKNVEFYQIAVGSLPVLTFIYFFLLLTLLGFVRAPIQSAVPLRYRQIYGGILSIGFYMFWAGMFGEAVSGGFAQICKSK